MKLTSRTKKLLTVVVLVFAVSLLSGCSIPTDEAGNIIQITDSTTFGSIMADENWFGAFLVFPLAKAINALTPSVGVGLAIALVTIIVNVLLAAATMKSTIASQQMQMIQPELEKIQRKYEGRDDETSKMRQANEMNALYRKYNINPAATLLVTFLQFPIIMGMYMAVQRSAAVRTGTFLGIPLETRTMDGIKSLFSGNTSGAVYLVLFLVMIGCQALSVLLPTYLSKKKAKEEAAKHHKRVEPGKSNMTMSIYMIGMISVFGLMFPTAMVLYWAINSLVTVVKTLVVQKVIESKKAA